MEMQNRLIFQNQTSINQPNIFISISNNLRSFVFPSFQPAPNSRNHLKILAGTVSCFQRCLHRSGSLARVTHHLSGYALYIFMKSGVLRIGCNAIFRNRNLPFVGIFIYCIFVDESYSYVCSSFICDSYLFIFICVRYVFSCYEFRLRLDLDLDVSLFLCGHIS